MRLDEVLELQRLAAGGRVLELGSWKGGSTAALCQVAHQVVAVDWHYGDPHAGQLDTLPDYLATTGPYRVGGNLITVVGRFDQVLPLLRESSFDLIFVDGYHDADATAGDIELSRPLLAPDGFIAVHDWGLYGVARACKAILGMPRHIAHTLAVYQP